MLWWKRAKLLVALWVSVLPLFKGYSFELILLGWREVALEGGSYLVGPLILWSIPYVTFHMKGLDL